MHNNAKLSKLNERTGLNPRLAFSFPGHIVLYEPRCYISWFWAAMVDP